MFWLWITRALQRNSECRSLLSRSSREADDERREHTVSTTNQQRRAQHKRQRHSKQRQRAWQARGAEHDRYDPGGAEDFLETVAVAYADSGRLSLLWLDEASRIKDLDDMLSALLARHWTAAQGRGWDEPLARRGLRKLGAEHAQALFEGEPLPLRDRLALLGWVIRLPTIPTVTRRRAEGDTRILDRVRALLAKAESTQYPEEADAFTAKAQQLITEHCLQEALSGAAASDEPGLVRILADDPYADARSLLITVVATANRCRAVWLDRFGFATVVGYASDLDAVEVIHSSLLVQATRSMALAGSGGRQQRSPSFRRSFLFAFASRIGERLFAAQELGLESVADDRLLPVLSRRDSRVEDVTNELFPHLVEQAASITNGHGWAAGMSAADHANLLPFEGVEPVRTETSPSGRPAAGNLSDAGVIVSG